jgi:hydroxyethylthiazole kinase-like uncharacterized protein yjeF
MADFDLMKLAATHAAEWVRRLAANRSVTVLCGPGNNGGDGYVMAHRLHKAGLRVQVVAPVSPKTLSAKKAHELWGREVLTSGGSAEGEVLVDCLFGSGLTRPLSGAHMLLLRDLAERHALVIALDLPSGIATDTGMLLNDKLPNFDVTLAIGAWKLAHCLLPGRAKMGVQRLVPIGVSEVEGAAIRLPRPQILAPASDSHKYKRGLAVVIGGEMPGAAMLSARAAMRSGAGYLKLCAEDASNAPPDLVVDRSDKRLAMEDERVDARLIGPGLGRGEEAPGALADVLKCGGRAVLDADALQVLEPSLLGDHVQVIATPHDGELEALCRKFSVIAEGRMAKAKTLAGVSGMVICAKGPDTFVAAPDGRVAIAAPASSGLSIAGTGDVLAGIAVSRLATGTDPFTAACEAVWLHGEAARLCGPALTPLDLIDALPSAVANCL